MLLFINFKHLQLCLDLIVELVVLDLRVVLQRQVEVVTDVVVRKLLSNEEDIIVANQIHTRHANGGYVT